MSILGISSTLSSGFKVCSRLGGSGGNTHIGLSSKILLYSIVFRASNVSHEADEHILSNGFFRGDCIGVNDLAVRKASEP